MRESRGEPYVGDSCSIYGFTRETIELAGYGEMSRRTGVPCVPLDSGEVRPVQIGGVHLRDTYLSEYVLDADVIISVPKLKPHDHVEFTGRNCVRCMTCIESCDNGAVTLKVPRILHNTYRRKSPGYYLSKMR